MKLLLAGIPVSPSRMTEVFTAYGVTAVAAEPVSAGSCRAAVAPRAEVPFTGLARTRAFAAVPTIDGVWGHVSLPGVVGGSRPAAMPQRKRQHNDLDPQRPRPHGGCA